LREDARLRRRSAGWFTALGSPASYYLHGEGPVLIFPGDVLDLGLLARLYVRQLRLLIVDADLGGLSDLEGHLIATLYLGAWFQDDSPTVGLYGFDGPERYLHLSRFPIDGLTALFTSTLLPLFLPTFLRLFIVLLLSTTFPRLVSPTTATREEQDECDQEERC